MGILKSLFTTAKPIKKAKKRKTVTLSKPSNVERVVISENKKSSTIEKNKIKKQLLNFREMESVGLISGGERLRFGNAMTNSGKAQAKRLATSKKKKKSTSKKK